MAVLSNCQSYINALEVKPISVSWFQNCAAIFGLLLGNQGDSATLAITHSTAPDGLASLDIVCQLPQQYAFEEPSTVRNQMFAPLQRRIVQCASNSKWKGIGAMQTWVRCPWCALEVSDAWLDESHWQPSHTNQRSMHCLPSCEHAASKTVPFAALEAALGTPPSAHGPRSLVTLGAKCLAPGGPEDEAVLQALAAGLQPWDSRAAAAHGLIAGTTALQATRALVLGRLQRVRALFPSASAADLQSALLTYSPESALFTGGYSSTEPVASSTQWEKFQGELHYGDYKAFHNGAADVLGADIADGDAMASIMRNITDHGGSNDKYNLWYLGFCAAVEQPEYNKRGERKSNVFDEGHAGFRLADFARLTNDRLERAASKNRVTDAGVLALRLYSASTFAPMNKALRDKGAGRSAGELCRFRACIQSARKCLLKMAAIKRPHVDTFRGVTGYLAVKFESERIGMDFAFFSATTEREVASKFVGSAKTSVLFEIAYISGCPGVDISELSVYPGQKEVLFPPCTGLNLDIASSGGGSGGGGGGAGAGSAGGGGVSGETAGQARVRVTPTAAM
jgi:hypothetical protein